MARVLPSTPSGKAARTSPDSGCPSSSSAATEATLQLTSYHREFTASHRPSYLRYAKVRLKSEGTSRLAVEGALCDLAAKRTAALSSASLPAVAWKTLVTRVGGGSEQAPDTLRRLLSDQQADAVILRHRLGLGIRDIAQIMGVSQPVIISQLRRARNALQHRAIGR
ncbi:sigma factor-like helix-turn-helix DNA-binding protein [Streptomyces lydicus]